MAKRWLDATPMTVRSMIDDLQFADGDEVTPLALPRPEQKGHREGGADTI